MNYKLLDKLIPRRRLPDDASAPRVKLFEMLRALDELRQERIQMAKTLPPPDSSEQSDLDQQIAFYEQIFEEKATKQRQSKESNDGRCDAS